jgi:hypothetical protein
VARERNAVKRFVPPNIRGNLQPRDRRGVIDHLGNLFLERHPRDQISDPLLHRLRRIEEREALRGGAGRNHRNGRDHEQDSAAWECETHSSTSRIIGERW